MTTLNQRIAALTTQRGQTIRAYEAILNTAVAGNRDLNDAEQAALDEQRQQLDSLDGQIARWQDAEAVIARAATPTSTAVTVIPPDGSTQLVPFARSMQRRDAYPAADFTRSAIALILGRGIPEMAAHIARERWQDDQLAEIVQYRGWQAIMRAPVGGPQSTLPGGVPPTGTGMGGDSLIRLEHLGAQFIELLRPMLIATRLPSMRRLEFNNAGTLRIPRQTGGVSGGYIGEGQSIRVQRLNFQHIDLVPSKLAVIVPTTNELLRRSDPSIEQLIRDDMLLGTALTVDNVFFSTAPAAASPAGILFGIPENVAGEIPAGATVTQVTEALKAMISALRFANVPMTAPVWIMSARTKEFLRLQRTTATEIFAWKAEVDAGTLLGYPIIDTTSIPVPFPPGLLNQTAYALIDCSQVIWADDMMPVVDASEHATIQLDDAPPTPPVPPYWSAFQNDSVFMRIRMSHTWARRHDVAVTWALTDE